MNSYNGQSRFSGFCPYLHYTVVFRHVNKTCLKLTALQVPSCQTFFKINFKLGMDLSPVLPVTGLFFRDIHGCQIQHFQKAVIRRKYRLAFGHFFSSRIQKKVGRYVPFSLFCISLSAANGGRTIFSWQEQRP